MLLSLLSSTLFRTIQSLSIIICSCPHLASTGLAGITFTGLIPCLAISCPGILWISNQNIFALCPNLNLKTFKWQQLYETWPYMGSIMICPSEYNHICCVCNSSCFKVHLDIDDRIYGSFGSPIFLIQSINTSHRPTLVYEIWNCFGDRTVSLPLDTQQITTLNHVFANLERLFLTGFCTLSHKSEAGCLSPSLSFFLPTRNLLSYFFNTISTHCCQIHSALSKLTNGSQFVIVSWKFATGVSQCGIPPWSCLKQFLPQTMEW